MEKAKKEKKCFTITWKIENASYCLQKHKRFIHSPSFVIDEIEGVKWALCLCPRGYEGFGNFMSCFLKCKKDERSLVSIKVKFDITLMEADDCESSHPTIVNDFQKHYWSGYLKQGRRKDVYDTLRHKFLPQDTLTIRCQIWEIGGESMTQDVRCFARTIIGVEKRSFLKPPKKLSEFELDKKRARALIIESQSNQNEPIMFISSFATGGINCDEIIRYEPFPLDRTKYSTFRVSLVDASGNLVECNQEEFWYGEYYDNEKFTLPFSKKKLLANKEMLLPNDGLTLHWHCAFSRGIVFEEIEEIQYGCTDDREMKEPPSNPLLDSLKCFYEENLLCDVKLKTSTGTFPAHKIVLSASSPVFKTMFSSDRKGTDRDCVDIEDMSDDTIKQMLDYIYTSSPGDLIGESATRLYDAANKYALVGLKNACVCYLKDNLSSSNGLDILLLADRSTDGGLKAAVLHYVEKYGKEIEESAWKMLMDANGKLAAEVLYNMLSKN